MQTMMTMYEKDDYKYLDGVDSITYFNVEL